MYKSKEKQKEANRQWIANKRANGQNKTLQDRPQSNKFVVPDVVVPLNVVPNVVPNVAPITYGSHGPHGTPNRVAVPGDSDYKGCCVQDEAGNCKVEPFEHDNSMYKQTPPNILESNAQLEERQRQLHSHDETVRQRLAATPFEQLKAEGAFIPQWRYVQG